MGYTISICGKGGTGKTSMASLIVRYLKDQNKGPVLAIDADPNSTLGEALGIKTEASIVSIVDEFSKERSTLPAGMTKERYLEYKLHDALVEADGFDLLAMGRPEGPGCYCSINNLLRMILEKLTRSYPFVVIDNEAGMEHLSRRTARSADMLFILSDSSVVGLRSAKRILELTDELDIKIGERYLVVNRVKGSLGGLKDEIEGLGLKLIGSLPEDESLSAANTRGGSLSTLPEGSPIAKAVWEICEKTLVNSKTSEVKV